MTQTAPARLESIQALRAIAAFAVVLGHIAQLEMRFPPDPVFGPYWFFGFSGVDLFFVISGFVMVHVTRQVDGASGSQVGRFLFARVTRIFPPYWLFTLVALVGFLLVPALGSRGLDDLSIWRSFLLLPDRSLPVLPIGWTLVHELYFYIVFTAILFVPRRFLTAALAVWMAVIIGGDLAGLRNTGAVANLVFNPLTAEFGIGCAIALMGQRGGRVSAWAAIGAAVLMFAIAAWAISPQFPQDLPSDWRRVATQGLPCALLVFGILTLERVGDVRPPRWLVVIGDWSYALYLSHLLVLLAGVTMWSRFVPDLGPFDNIAMAVIGIAGSLAVAGIAYQLFEKPMLGLAHRWRDRLFPASAPLSPKTRDERIW